MNNKPHARRFSHYPLLQLALAYSLGVIFANLRVLKLAPLIISCCICSLVVLGSVVRKWLRLSGFVLLITMFLAGTSLSIIEKTSRAHDSLRQMLASGLVDKEQPVTLTGIVDGPAEFAGDRVYFRLRVENITSRNYSLNASGLVTLLVTFKTAVEVEQYRQLNLHYGTRLRLRTTLNREDKYRNPGLSTLTEYLDRKGYDATGLVKGPQSIERVGDAEVFRPLAWLYGWRERIQFEIDNRFSAETAGVLDAALLGNRYNLLQSTVERFRDAGTFHVLVISGLHISFIGGLIIVVAKRITRSRLLQFILSSSVVWGYTLAVGAEASVVRAALMFTFVTLGAVVFRSASALNGLGGAAVVLLIKSPGDLFDPSFQLTFLSVLAIVTIAWPLLQTFSAIGSWQPARQTPHPPECSRAVKAVCEGLFWSEVEWRKELARSPHHYRLFKTSVAAWLERFHLQQVLRYIFSAVVVSVAVQISLLPLLVVYFHRLSVSSLVLNIGVSLLLAVLGAIALAALLLYLISPAVAEPLLRLANGIDWIMVHSVDPFARLGLASVRLPEYSGWSSLIYFAYYVPLVVLVFELSRWRPLAAPIATRHRKLYLRWPFFVLQFLLLAIVLIHPLSAGRSDGKLHIDFLDVGQGDSALVTMPNGSTLLVDGGGRPTFISNGRNLESEANEKANERETRSIGEMVVSEYLWWRGLDSVDYVLATHADADHIDGLNDVIRNFSVRCALVGRTPLNDGEYARFAHTLSATRTHVETIQAGDILRFGEVIATVLWPIATDDPDAPSGNNDSIVLRLQYGERSILLTGDIEKEAESKLAPTQNLNVDVIKVPHHGSRTSSTQGFVTATSPTVAIISVGQTSMFGHPHKDVVERWRSSGAEVLTTGLSGTISVTTNGKDLSVTKFVQ